MVRQTAFRFLLGCYFWSARSQKKKNDRKTTSPFPLPKPHPKQDIHPERPRWEILFLIFAHFFGAFFRKAETHKKKHSPINPFAFPAKTASSSVGWEGGGVLRQTDKSRCPKMRKSLPGLTETEAGRQEELEEKIITTTTIISFGRGSDA